MKFLVRSALLALLMVSMERYIIGVSEKIPMGKMLVERQEEISDGLIWERMLRIRLRK